MGKCEHWAALRWVIIENHADFQEKWEGWKMRGDTLISPEGLRLRNPQLRVLFSVHGTTKRPRKKTETSEQLELF